MEVLRLCVRLALLVLCLLSMFFCLYIAPLGLPWVKRSGSLSQKVKWLRIRIVSQHLRALGWSAGLRLFVSGDELPQDQPYLLLANHISYWDIIAIGGLWPLGFLAKADIQNWFFLGSLAKRSQAVFVVRESVEGRVRALRGLQLQLRDLPFCVFPEGTTTAALVPGPSPWHRGHIVTVQDPGVPLYVVGLHYAKQEAQAWVGDDGLVPHLLRSLRQPSIDLSLHVQKFVGLRNERSFHEISREAHRQLVRACNEAMQLAPWTSSRDEIKRIEADSALR